LVPPEAGGLPRYLQLRADAFHIFGETLVTDEVVHGWDALQRVDGRVDREPSQARPLRENPADGTEIHVALSLAARVVDIVPEPGDDLVVRIANHAEFEISAPLLCPDPVPHLDRGHVVVPGLQRCLTPRSHDSPVGDRFLPLMFRAVIMPRIDTVRLEIN